MSAKSAEKSLKIRLDANELGALKAYAAANGDRSLSAALRRAVRADLGLCADRRSTTVRPARRGRVLRLQLEPALRARLAPDAARGARSALARRLGDLTDLGERCSDL